MRYKISLAGKDYIVEVEQGDVIMVDVKDTAPAAPPAPVSQAAATAAAPTATAPTAPAPTAPTATTPGEAVTAPMNGLILSLNVAAGAAVKAGDVLCVLEAMKMENEITSPRDGLVASLAVAKGSQVETGQALLFLE